MTVHLSGIGFSGGALHQQYASVVDNYRFILLPINPQQKIVAIFPSIPDKTICGERVQ